MGPVRTRRIAVIGMVAAVLLPAWATTSQAVTGHLAHPQAQGRAVLPTEPGAYVALPPARIVDTAIGLGGWSTPGPGLSIFPTVSGVGGVPGAAAVLLSVTAASPTAGGDLDVYPAGSAGGDAISLYFAAHQTTANLVLTPLGNGGRVAIKNGSLGTTRIVVDVQGYVVAGTPASPGALESFPAFRIYKTFSRFTRLPARSTLVLDIDSNNPRIVGASVLNVTAAGPDAGGYLTVYPTGTTRPTTSNVNFRAGSFTSNLVLARLGANGAVSIYNGSNGTTSLYVDVQGHTLVGAASALGNVQPLAPARIVDTAIGLGVPRAPLAGVHPLDVAVLGRGGVPATGVSAVVLNVTVASAQHSGYLSVYPSGGSRPGTSNLNFSAGRTVAGLVVVPVGADGKVTVYSGSTGSIRLVADVQGYVLGD